MSDYQKLVGKKLFNSNGFCAGKIVGVVHTFGQDCFEVDESENKGMGRYWQVSRLNNGKSDQIQVS